MASNSIVLRCGHCGNKTALYERAEYHFDDYSYCETSGFVERVEWRILQCPACEKPVLHQNVGLVGSEGRIFYDEGSPRVLYPIEKVIPDSVPEDVATAYREALRMAPLSPNACAVQVARTLEITCRREGALSRNLQQRLSNLATSGRIPDTLGRMAQQVRQIRNLGAHVDATGDEVQESDIPVILDFMDAILEYLYVAPARIDALEARLNDKGK